MVIFLDNFRLSHMEFPFFCPSKWKYWQFHVVPFNQFYKLLVISRHRLVFVFLVGLMGVGTRTLLLLVSLSVPPCCCSWEVRLLLETETQSCAISFLSLML